MKKSLFSLLFCFSLTACQTTQDVVQDEDVENDSVFKQCSVNELFETDFCEAPAEGVAELIHPVEKLPLPVLVPEPPEKAEKNIYVETNLWAYISNELELAIPTDEPRLDSQRNWYLKHPRYMQRVSNRASPFLYFIVQELEQNNMPLDLALLPIVESAFDPFAYSHGQAAGMWQFIPETGERFGMPQNWWYDGRRDVVSATRGAIAYLNYLHEMFDGNWLHALAAYNSGEGRVKRAIRRNKLKNKPTDFWSLDLPRETRAYVPKLLALADILKQRELYGFNWPEMDNAPVVEIVEVEHQIDLAKAASLAGLTVAELQALNPGFNRWATAPGGPHRFILPLDRADAFKGALSQTSKNEFITWERHKIRNGESLGVIANKYNTSIDAIRLLNNIRGNTIIAGDHILVPVATKALGDYPLSVDQRLASTQAAVGTSTVTHEVQVGDTLWDIARAYKVPVRSLAKWNAMAPRDTLKVGSKLVIEQPDDKPQNITRNIRYSVRSGDSLSRIANKFKVKISDIVKWNSLQGEKYLQPGQVLKLIVDITNT